MVANDGEVDLSIERVVRSEIGVCLQVDPYDIARLTDGVIYVDNDTNLDATNLPIPGVAPRIGGAE